jgi:ribonuclease HII
VANKKFVVKLSSEERKRLSELISKGKSAAKIVLKARILLKADQSEEGECWTDEEICEALDTNVAMVTRVRSKLVDDGLDAVLTRKKRATPPIQPIFDGERQAQLIALAGIVTLLGLPAVTCARKPLSWPSATSDIASRP